jgi:erythromycin esterase-like protein
MPNHTPLQTGWEMTEPSTALTSFLNTLPITPQLLGMGEPTHGVDTFPAWRNRIFRSLVEHHGYRSIAIESDVLAGLSVNAHITAGQGTLDEIMQDGFSHGFGEVKANRELVVWLREVNAGRDEADRVRFYGFDAPTENMWAASPRHSLLELHAYLAGHLPELPSDTATITHLCGDDVRWTNEAAAMDSTQSVGASENAKELRWLVDELLTLLETERPHLAGQPDEFWHARLHARTAQGLLRYHAVMADSSPNRVARMLTLRDVMMADNLTAIAEREAPRGPTLVFAHNSHLQRHFSEWTFGTMNLAWCPAGVHLAARVGERYAFIATTLGEGAGLPVPLPTTLEGWLNQQTSSPHLYATQALVRVLPPSLTKRTDTSGNRGYSPLKPEHLQQTNGVFFLPTLTIQESSQ